MAEKKDSKEQTYADAVINGTLSTLPMEEQRKIAQSMRDNTYYAPNADGSQEEPKKASGKGGGITVASIGASRNRGGQRFTRQPQFVSYDDLTQQQLEDIQNDPDLVVVEGGQKPEGSKGEGKVPATAGNTEAALGIGNGSGENATPFQMERLKEGEFVPHRSHVMSTTPGAVLPGTAPTTETVEATIKGAAKSGDKGSAPKESGGNPTRKEDK